MFDDEDILDDSVNPLDNATAENITGTGALTADFEKQASLATITVPTESEVYQSPMKAQPKNKQPVDPNCMHITVDDPQQISDTVGSHTEYLVEARQGEVLHSSVRRRYNHFDWLYQSLIGAHSALIIPPIPLTSLVVLNGDNTMHRMASLAKFVNGVCTHPILKDSTALNSFLTGDPSQFNNVEFHNVVNPFKPKGGTKKNPHLEIGQSFEQCTGLASNLLTVDQGMCKVLNSYLEISKLYKRIEHDFNTFAEKDTSVKVPCELFTKSLQEIDVITENFSKKYMSSFVIPVHQLRLTVNSAQRTILYHDDVLILKENIGDQIAKKTNDKQAIESGQTGISFGKLLGKSNEQIQREKVQQLTIDLNELNSKLENVSQVLEKDTKIVEEELKTWTEKRSDDVKLILHEFADCHIEYYEKGLESFSNILKELEACH